MPRIPVVTTREAGPLVRLAYRFAKRRFGAVPEPVAVSAHHRKLLVAGARHELGVEKAATTLPVSLRELVVYATAVTAGCSWCVDFGTMLIRHEGLDVDRLGEVRDYARSDRYTGLEKLALAYVEAMTATPTAVTDEQVAELDARLGHRGLVELTYLIALENQRARFNSALGITDQGFTSGAACRVPMP
ncbi:carboxymuconolactone decarboxylase family protein [Saccharothrix longispora]|uniref:carboxymuconolactone decarboxylase family protein n=1 Tax=Saccharothrix longispora TaxID=33920 RepID=UPI0028FD92C1|nr:carboxymuconolactone decarboxylase family protein [Saccharothrix longispora]MDU0290743.1 carboxymuconolactone decarboxylase family protein [Saccharothrix longispora]